MPILAPADLQRLAAAFAAVLALGLLSAALEGWVGRRGTGLRRRRGLPLVGGTLADTLKLLSRPAGAGPRGRSVAVAAATLPIVVLGAMLPAVGGLGLLGEEAMAAGIRVALWAGLSIASLAALAGPGALEPAARRQVLADVAPALVGGAVSLGIALAAVAAGPAAPAFADRTWQAWPVLVHPAGAAAALGAVVVIARSWRRALGLPALPGEVAAPGLAARPGAATVWLLGGRHLWIGAQAACAVHLYLGAGALPPAATLWGGCVVVLAAVAILQASVTDTDPEGLVRLAWTRLMPLALVDAALTAAQRAGWLPWS